jgi:hypothetical protein
VGSLQAEKSPVPARIMAEANILDPKFLLSRFPLPGPGQMGFVELLTQL